MPRKTNKGIMSPEQRQKMSRSVRNAMRKTDETGNPIFKSVKEIKVFLLKCTAQDVITAMQELQDEAATQEL